jgi:hypothetical protein
MQTQSKLLKWSLILGIVIVTNLFVNYSISLVVSEPQYNDFCPQTYAPTPASEVQQNLCSNNFTSAMNSYEAKIFIILVAVGAVLIVASFFLKTNPVVSTALSFAGLLSLVIASMRYWSSADNWLKVVILGIALAALIALAVKKFKNESLRS